MAKLAWLYLIVTLPIVGISAEASVRIKEIARVDGVRDNVIVGYGVVVGLAGSGDSSRSKMTLQSIANTLQKFGVNVSEWQVASRNVAAVMITTKLPEFAQMGDELDVNVSSMGDARSLLGGTLLMAPLKAPNGQIYALAQGPITTGGYKYDLNGNVVQKNHPTVGLIPGGAIVEKGLNTELMNNGALKLVLTSPDFTTANRVKDAINQTFQSNISIAEHASRISVRVPKAQQEDLIQFITQIENIEIDPDMVAKVVVNERTGTVVSGGDVRIAEITVSHGDLKVVITTEFSVSQPEDVAFVGDSIRTEVIPDTKISAVENVAAAISLPSGTTIADLVSALRKIKTSSRDIISILQTIKQAGALHAQLIVQ